MTLFRPQSNHCLVHVTFAVKKRASERERGAFLFVEAIPFSIGYYMMSDMDLRQREKKKEKSLNIKKDFGEKLVFVFS